MKHAIARNVSLGSILGAAAMTVAGVCYVSTSPQDVDEAAIRSQPAVRSAMDDYRKQHVACEWCCRSNVALQVHHELSVSLFPEYAADTNHYVALCAKCHLCIGHAGNYRDSVTNCKALVGMRLLAIRRDK